jgi:hypothetical protein
MSVPVNDRAGICLTSASGLRAQFNANGSLCRFDCDAVSLNLFPGNEIEGGPTNIYLRQRAAEVRWTPLLGPSSLTRLQSSPGGGGYAGSGIWRGIRYWISLRLAQESTAWFWHVQLENTTGAEQELDLIYAQDLALAPYGAVRMNEFYVSQYIDHTPLTDDSRGLLVASRQNAAVDGRYPWSLIGSLRAAKSYATDARQLYGLAHGAGEAPIGLAGDAPGRRLQHEHSMVVLRDAPLRLGAYARAHAGFFGFYSADHPGATSAADLQQAASTLSLSEAAPVSLAEPASPTSSTSEVTADTSFKASSLFSASSLWTWPRCRNYSLHHGGMRNATRKASCCLFFPGEIPMSYCRPRSGWSCGRMAIYCVRVAIQRPTKPR